MSEPDSFERFSQTDGVSANLKKKSIRGVVFMASGNAADIFVRFGSIAILARLLLPEDFGLIAMVMALTSILDGLRDFGLSAATIQRPDISHRQVTNLFWVNLAVGAFLALVIASGAPLIASFYQETRLIGIALALSLVFIWNGLTVQHEALLIRQLRQGELALIRLAASVISVVVAIGLALNDWGYWSLVWREVVRSALVTGGVWLRCLWLPGLPRRNVGTRDLLRFGGEITITHLLYGLIMHVDKLLIGRFFGPAPVGLYRQAQQLILAPMDQLNGPIVGVAQPALSVLQQDRGRYRHVYEKIVFFVGLVTLPLGLFIALYAKDITLLVLGSDWIEATIFVQIFGIGAAIRPVIGTSSIVLITCGLSTRYLVLTVVHAVVLAIVLLMAVRWGPAAIAIAYVGTTLVLLYPNLYFGFKDTPASISGFFKALIAPFSSAIVMTIVLSVMRSYAPIGDVFESLILGVCVGGAVYLLSIWLLPKGRSELSNLFTSMRAAMKTD